MAVAEICRRLDGMPLALELAAARVRSLTVQEIAQRLGARFRLLRGGAHGSVERHRTLQAAMQWSYDLLDRKDQEMFARLSVFAGGFSVDAAAAVCGDDAMDDIDAIDVLDAAGGPLDGGRRPYPGRDSLLAARDAPSVR